MEKIRLANGNEIDISSATSTALEFELSIEEFAKVYPQIKKQNLVEWQILSNAGEELASMKYYDITGKVEIRKYRKEDGSEGVRETIYIRRMTEEQIAIYEQSVALAEMASMVALIGGTGEEEA